MTREEFEAITGLLDEWWPGQLDEIAEDAWWVLFCDYDAAEVTLALKQYVARGQGTFRPTPVELVEVLRYDPSVPIFEEMVDLVFGPGGVLTARTSERKSVWALGEREKADEQAVKLAVEGLHPLVQGFIRVTGVERLQRLNVHDQEYGEPRLKKLETMWNRWLDTQRDRTAYLAAGGQTAGRLKRWGGGGELTAGS